MAASDFADLIISNLASSIGTDGQGFNSGTPAKANQAIADAVTEYLPKNTKIQVGYVGTITGPPPVPDPLVTDMCDIEGTCAPPVGTDFDTWIKSLESNIVAGFKISKGAGGVTPIAPPPAFIPGLSLSRDDIKSVHQANMDKPQKPVWTKICGDIITWLNSIVSSPYPAQNTNTSSTGVATPTKTIVT